MDGATSRSSAHSGPEKQIVVLAATNRPQDLDEALRRRFEKRIYIPLPSNEGRLQMFKLNTRSIPIDPEVEWDELVKATEGFSGADISNVCRDAALMPMRRRLQEGTIDIQQIKEMKDDLNVPITMSDFNEALRNVNKSVS